MFVAAHCVLVLLWMCKPEMVENAGFVVSRGLVRDSKHASNGYCVLG